tara:strand:+ start:60 stop:296 length:237 start_codon:yes stop_codon:yes gene_type:complete
MKTLYQRLKPELKTELLSNEKTYSSSVKRIILTLQSNHFYSDLRISQISSINTFTHCEDGSKWSSWDWKFGDKLFTDE